MDRLRDLSDITRNIYLLDKKISRPKCLQYSSSKSFTIIQNSYQNMSLYNLQDVIKRAV